MKVSRITKVPANRHISSFYASLNEDIYLSDYRLNQSIYLYKRKEKSVK
jgi:hypothetical protein